MNASFEAEIGRLNWKGIRNLVNSLNYTYGYNIQMGEGEGRLSRPFYFRGPESQMAYLESVLSQFEEGSR